MNNLEEKMQKRLDAWNNRNNPDYIKAKQKLSEYQQQEWDLLKAEEENNARYKEVKWKSH